MRVFLVKIMDEEGGEMTVPVRLSGDFSDSIRVLVSPEGDDEAPICGLQFNSNGTVDMGHWPDGEEWIVTGTAMRPIPEDFPVRPLGKYEEGWGRMTCGECGRSWDDAIATSYTPVPAGRCPFEAFH